MRSKKAKENSVYKMPLHLDAAAVKQLDKVKRVTGEATNTKAITRALYGFTEYKERYEATETRLQAAAQEVTNLKWSIKQYVSAVDSLMQLVTEKPAKTDEPRRKKS